MIENFSFSNTGTNKITQSNRILNTPGDFAKSNLLYIQEAGFLKSLRSHVSKREKLDSYLFLMVLSGQGKFTYQQEVYELNPKDCLLIDCNHSYSHESSEENPWELMWIHFSGNSVKPFLSYYNTLVPSLVFHVENTTDFSSGDHDRSRDEALRRQGRISACILRPEATTQKSAQRALGTPPMPVRRIPF